MDYLSALDICHRELAPRNYVEIGCRAGQSLTRARCPALAIDPDFEIRTPLTAPTRIFRETSDAFFAGRDLRSMLGGPVDFAFIDGMHRVEFALRDVLNLEAAAHPGAVIVVDDILPQNIGWTTRERQTQAWTGDVYKLIPFLRAHRPDLTIEVFDIEMKGLAVISGLDPDNRALQAGLAAHEEYLAGQEPALDSVAAIRAALAPRPAADLAGHVGALAGTRARPAETGSTPLYLDLLKRSLLNEIYLDDELRLLYLRDCLEGRDSFDYPTYHDIRDSRAPAFAALAASRAVGQFPDRSIHRSGFSHTMMGRARLDSLHACLDLVRREGISGDLMECGVWRGGGCIFMAGYLKAHGMAGRRVLVADSFQGLPPPSLPQDDGLDLVKARFPELAVSEESVRRNFAVHGLLDDTRLEFLKGWFRDTLADAPTERLALLRLDGDLYESTMDALTHLYDRVVPGGVVIVDDYGALPACARAVGDFFAARDEALPAMSRIDWTGVWFRKPERRA